MKKLLYILCNTVSVLLIVAALLVLLTSVLTRQGKLPNLMGYSLFQVMTGSMKPALDTNDLILVKATEEVQEGDIIAFYSADPELSGVVVTHRVVRIDENGITTKGDANAVEDGYPVETLVGIVVYHSAALGALVNFIRHPLVFVLMILLPLAYLLLSNLLQTIRLAREVVRQEEQEEREKLEELWKTMQETQKGEARNEAVSEKEESI